MNKYLEKIAASPYFQRLTVALGFDRPMTLDDYRADQVRMMAQYDAPMFTSSLKPSGSDTYKGELQLLDTMAQSERGYLRFNEEVLVIGVLFTILPITFPRPAIMPNWDDIEVSIDTYRGQEYAIARQGTSQNATGPTSRSGYASLQSQDIRTRFLMKPLPITDGEMGFQFRSAYGGDNGGNLGLDCRVRFEAIVKPFKNIRTD